MKVNCSYYDHVGLSWIPACIEFCFGTLGNILALVVLWMSRRHDVWRPFDKLFAGLTLCNLFSIILVHPFIFKIYASNFTWCYNQALCDFNSFLLVNNHLSSALLICAMSVDQFLITYDERIRSSRLRKNKWNTIIVVALMIVSVLISVLHVAGLGLGSSRLFFPGSWCYLDFISQTTAERNMSYFVVSVGIFLILLIVLFNALSFWKFYTNPYLRSSAKYNQTGRNQCCSNMNVFVMTISVVFIVLWTPFLVRRSYTFGL
jgi:prostaglandin E receptor 4